MIKYLQLVFVFGWNHLLLLYISTLHTGLVSHICWLHGHKVQGLIIKIMELHSCRIIGLCKWEEKKQQQNQQKTIQWRRSKALERMGNFSGITCSLYVFTRHFKWLTMKNEEGRWQKKRIGSHRSSQHIRVITIFHHFQYMFLYMTRLPSTLSISFVALPTVTSQCGDCMQKRSLNTSLKLTLKQRSRWNTTKMVYVAAIQFRDQSMNHRNYQKMTKSCEILPQRIEKFSIFEWICHNF